MEIPDILRIEKKLNDSSIKFAKFSNIDYKKYVEMKEILSSFKNFISYIIKSKIKKIKRNNFKSLFENMDSFIKEKFESEKKENNVLVKLKNFFTGGNDEQKEKDIEIKLDIIDLYIKYFKEILIEFKFINNEYDLNKNDKKKDKNYIIKYLNLKNKLKKNKYYQKSFYEEFK